jgi:hypothetical protein
MEIQEVIIKELTELFEEDAIPVPDFSDDLVLLDSNLDSLGFAVLVTRLDEVLGYDPFSLMDEPIYPVTLGDFFGVYEKFAKERKT